jgi:hypothetical protein
VRNALLLLPYWSCAWQGTCVTLAWPWNWAVSGVLLLLLQVLLGWYDLHLLSQHPVPSASHNHENLNPYP